MIGKAERRTRDEHQRRLKEGLVEKWKVESGKWRVESGKWKEEGEGATLARTRSDSLAQARKECFAQVSKRL